MRLRFPFAAAFLVLLACSAYLGLFQARKVPVDDKILHFLTFFVLTLCFYWVLDTSRRRTLHLTLVICTVISGIGSEFVQGWVPNGRVFDVLDIVANVVGSLAAVALCSWYHRRMIERKRQARRYQAVPGDDVELGEGTSSIPDASAAVATPSLDHEIDNWDENIEDEDDPTDVYAGGTRPPDGEANADPATPSKERNE